MSSDGGEPLVLMLLVGQSQSNTELQMGMVAPKQDGTRERYLEECVQQGMGGPRSSWEIHWTLVHVSVV